jgi:hypothetical protein
MAGARCAARGSEEAKCIVTRKLRPRVSTRCGGDSFFITGDGAFDEGRVRTTANGG